MGPKRGKAAKGSASASPAPTNTPPPASTPAEKAAEALRNMGIIATYAQNAKKQHANVRDIAVRNITVTFHGSPLLEETELSLNYGNRYGFIGRNGSGKSTFMKVIAARCFEIPEGIDMYHVSEEIEASDMTAMEAVMSVDTERNTLEAEAELLNDFMAEGAGGGGGAASEELGADMDEAGAMDRLTQIYERLEELDAATAEARASKILSGLGFTKEKQNKKTREFSGGWRMRIALARALFIQPTLLLLDEPTNHLDMEAVVWLEDYLSKWKKILFFVSHSQDFMNTVCTHVVHLTRKQLVYYGGNYDAFVNTRTELEEEQSKRYKAEQDQIQHMKEYVARFGQGNAKMAKQAQSKEKTLAKMVRGGLTDKVEVEKALDFKFPDPGQLSPPVLQCNDITFGYPGSPVLYSGVDFGVDLDSRIALVGPNGAGKSTLLKLITGEILPLTGSVRPHAHLRFSKFSQHFIDVLDLQATPIDYFTTLWPDMTREETRKYLGRFGCSGAVQTQRMEQLSDGQKSRVVFAKMAKEAPHLLLLDEPTNHLDMESIDSLAKAINSFTGGMMLVSHDMRLISQVAKEIWVVDNLTVSLYTGEIKDFKMDLRRQMQSANLIDADAVGSSSAAAAAASAGKSKLVPLTCNYGSAAASVPSIVPVNTVITPSGGGISLGGAPKAKAAAPVETEEDAIRRARLELAELAIQKQRARQNADAAGAPPPPPPTAEEQAAAAAEAEEKEAEKARAKEEKRRLKELVAQREAQEEAEREERRKERLQIIAEANALKEETNRQRAEAAAKKRKEAEEAAAAEAAERARLEEEAKALKAQREARKMAKYRARQAALAEERRKFVKSVRKDVWTQEEQKALEAAVMQFGWYMDRTERWNAIAKAVSNITAMTNAPAPAAASAAEGGAAAEVEGAEVRAAPVGKTRNQCLRRYRLLKEIATQRLVEHKKVTNGV